MLPRSRLTSVSHVIVAGAATDTAAISWLYSSGKVTLLGHDNIDVARSSRLNDHPVNTGIRYKSLQSRVPCWMRHRLFGHRCAGSCAGVGHRQSPAAAHGGVGWFAAPKRASVRASYAEAAASTILFRPTVSYLIATLFSGLTGSRISIAAVPSAGNVDGTAPSLVDS